MLFFILSQIYESRFWWPQDAELFGASAVAQTACVHGFMAHTPLELVAAILLHAYFIGNPVRRWCAVCCSGRRAGALLGRLQHRAVSVISAWFRFGPFDVTTETPKGSSRAVHEDHLVLEGDQNDRIG